MTNHGLETENGAWRERIALAAFVVILAAAFFAAGSGRLIGDELTFARAAHSDPFGTFSQTRFYRVLGNPIHNSVFLLAGDSMFALTLAAAVLIGLIIVLVTRCVVRGFDRPAGCEAALAAILVTALPFSMYGLLVRVVFSQLAAVALLAGACAAAFSYTRCEPGNRAARYRSLALGAVAYALSVFTYEVTLLTPLAVFCILTVCTPGGEKRKNAVREWVVALGIVFVVYVISQAAFPAANPKLLNGVQPRAAERAGVSLPTQAVGKIDTLRNHVTWAWRLTAGGMRRGDWRALSAILAMAAAAIGVAVAAGRRSRLSRHAANGVALTGLAVFVSTMGLWSFYWFRDDVLTTPPMYTMLLPNCGLALIIVGLLARLPDVRGRAIRTLSLAALVAAGVGTNVAILNANRMLKDASSDAEAAILLITGER